MHASVREMARRMDPLRPPDRLRGSENHEYDQSDESRWLHGGTVAKRHAADFGLSHAGNKGLFQVHRGSQTSLRNVADRHYGPEATTHKLLVYNTFLISVHGVFDTAPEAEARAMDIGRMIAREDYDIACLCEVFDSEDGDLIRARVDDQGDTNWAEGFGPDSSGFDISGGLHGLVKQNGRRLTGTSQAEYSDGGEGADEWSNKGWLMMEIDLGPGTVDVFSTHADAGADDHESRKGQLKELMSAIERRQRSHPDHVTMAVGDFNVYSSEPEYEWLLEEMHRRCSLRDTWLTHGGKAGATHAFDSKCTNSGPPDCACQDYVAGDYGGDRLDYIFVQDPKPEHAMYLDLTRVRRRPFPRAEPCGDLDPRDLEDDEMTYMSDHVGLDVELIASPRAS